MQRRRAQQPGAKHDNESASAVEGATPQPPRRAHERDEHQDAHRRPRSEGRVDEDPPRALPGCAEGQPGPPRGLRDHAAPVDVDVGVAVDVDGVGEGDGDALDDAVDDRVGPPARAVVDKSRRHTHARQQMGQRQQRRSHHRDHPRTPGHERQREQRDRLDVKQDRKADARSDGSADGDDDAEGDGEAVDVDVDDGLNDDDDHDGDGAHDGVGDHAPHRGGLCSSPHEQGRQRDADDERQRPDRQGSPEGVAGGNGCAERELGARQISGAHRGVLDAGGGAVVGGRRVGEPVCGGRLVGKREPHPREPRLVHVARGVRRKPRAHGHRRARDGHHDGDDDHDAQAPRLRARRTGG